MKEIQQYDIFELPIDDVQGLGLVEGCAEFSCGSINKAVPAFKAGENRYLVRFMPEEPGTWHYTVKLGRKIIEGEFTCTENTGANHGPVHTEGHHFRYADGTRYLPFGTTCYVWTHQTEALQQQTLETLKQAPFNKIRMCVFPKDMPYNKNDPEFYPFHRDAGGNWDLQNPDERYWEHLDMRLRQLAKLGIEADLILFHPYDRWGFANMGRKNDLAYLDYCIARLAAHRNVWWSLANEYDVVVDKDYPDWDAFGELVAAKDPYRHPVSIHNCLPVYPKRDWMTHCSIQSGDINQVMVWQKEYDLPVLIDECGYEGDIEFDWGNLSAFEMVHRFWWTIARGGYCTHGETFHREDQVLWWAKGGVLYGESAKRIAFLRRVLEDISETLEPVQDDRLLDPNSREAALPDLEEETGFPNGFLRAFSRLSADEQTRRRLGFTTMTLQSESFRLLYYGRTCPSLARLALPEAGRYRVEILDIWNMTRMAAAENASGATTLPLLGREGTALLVTRLEGAALN